MDRKLKIKVCGMKDSKNIMDVAALLPDFMGFIFYQGSKRFVDSDFVIPENFPASIRKVGVFVNENVESVLAKVKKHRLDFIQLHGDETFDVCQTLRKQVKVIKVFRVNKSFDFRSTFQFVSCSDFFLFDTKSENYGGTGKQFNWTLLKNYDQPVPFFLSGGVSLSNLSELTEVSNPKLYGLDVNSGVEASPGLKDLSILNTMINKINAL